jgi:hypothetical protein
MRLAPAQIEGRARVASVERFEASAVTRLLVVSDVAAGRGWEVGGVGAAL